MNRTQRLLVGAALAAAVTVGAASPAMADLHATGGTTSSGLDTTGHDTTGHGTEDLHATAFGTEDLHAT